MKHRCNIAIGRFGEYRTVLTTTRLPQRLKLRLYGTIVSTMAYGSSTWLFVDSLKRTLNGIDSKMLAMITKQTIHEEAKHHHMMW